MGQPYVRIIQAVALAAAILGLLLSTPSLEARTKPKHKKMKIVFDSNEPAPDQGELGDEVVQPKLTHHALNDPREVIRLRGSSVDDLYAKATVPKKVREIQHRAQPELIAGPDEGGIEERAHAAKRTTIGDSLAVDESALAEFKPKTSKHKASRHVVAKTKVKMKSKLKPTTVAAHSFPQKSAPGTHEPRLVKPAAKSKFVTASAFKTAQDSLDFDATSQPQTQPQTQIQPRSTPQPQVHSQTPPQRSRIYLRDLQPVVHQQANARQVSEPSDFDFNVAFENTTSGGRRYELETPGGRNFMMKNELFIGTRHTSGWGAKLSANYISTSNDDSSKDVREMGDPSVIVEHPALYQNSILSVNGFARYYMPVSASSKTVGLQHLAYYLIADLKLAEGFDLNNSFIPRYYVQNQYADADAFSLLYDQTELGKHINDWLRLGLGQRSQIESHQASQPGTSVEIYPFAEILAIAKTTIQTRVYVPLIAHGTVNGAPGSPAGPVESGLSNMQAELFARIAF